MCIRFVYPIFLSPISPFSKTSTFFFDLFESVGPPVTRQRSSVAIAIQRLTTPHPLPLVHQSESFIQFPTHVVLSWFPHTGSEYWKNHFNPKHQSLDYLSCRWHPFLITPPPWQIGLPGRTHFPMRKMASVAFALLAVIWLPEEVGLLRALVDSAAWKVGFLSFARWVVWRQIPGGRGCFEYFV